jgi:DNA-directed RNA polymerase subunit omega
MVEETEQLVGEANGEPRENQVVDSKYRMIILAAQRSKQLQRGALPRVDADPRKTKATRIALRELDKGKVHFEMTQLNAVAEKEAADREAADKK